MFDKLPERCWLLFLCFHFLEVKTTSLILSLFLVSTLLSSWCFSCFFLGHLSSLPSPILPFFLPLFWHFAIVPLRMNHFIISWVWLNILFAFPHFLFYVGCSLVLSCVIFPCMVPWFDGAFPCLLFFSWHWSSFCFTRITINHRRLAALEKAGKQLSLYFLSWRQSSKYSWVWDTQSLVKQAFNIIDN